MTEAQGFMVIGVLWAIVATQHKIPAAVVYMAAFVALVNIILAAFVALVPK